MIVAVIEPDTGPLHYDECEIVHGAKVKQADEKVSPSSAGREPILDVSRWVETHGDALFGFAFARLRVRVEAEDAVQETFLAALGAQTRYQGESGERAWLFGILKHKIVDRLRTRGREIALESDEQADALIAENFNRSGHWRVMPQRWARPDEDAEREEFWKVLAGCLGRLPDTLETTFRLVELDGVATEEVCKVLGISATNVWVRLHRARLSLRECLERNWFGKDAVRKGAKRGTTT
ncbi:MAG: sigma-70 family RNA polymerase sigma factor [Gammaproteobacteria bacterium]